MKQECKKIEKVICSHCGYSWFTKSKLITVTCPSCKYTTKNSSLN
jgi:predicted nucleic-acid-binding Zn-ribbon protein